MDVREKLVELIDDFVYNVDLNYWYPEEQDEKLADDLIAHGVTVQEWSSVSEPPEENGYYLCYVLTSAVGGKVKYEQMPLYWEDDIWLYRHNSYRMCRNVTHWMPLPQPPKGD